MVRGYAGAMGAVFSWVAARLWTRAAAAGHERQRYRGGALMLLLALVTSALPAFAQTVSSTVSPGSFTAANEVLTFTFNVNSSGSPINGVSFGGVPGPLHNSTCGALAGNGTCTATYTTTAEDVTLGGIQVSLSFTMARSGSGSWSGNVASSTGWISMAGVPGTPGVIAASAGPRSATLSFSPSAENGGGTVSYAVSALPLDGGVPGSAQGSGSPITVTGLTGGRRYQLFINGFNAAGGSLQGGPSNTVIAQVAAPQVSGLNRTSGPNAGGTSVTINGQYFSGASQVRFGSTAATAFTVISDTQIVATAPAGTGTVDVIVTTSDGTSAAVAGSKFAYIPPPTVSAVLPGSGPLAGGTTVVITGSNLGAANAVRFGSVAAAAYTVDSATRITATAPAGTAGTVDIRVTTAGGTSATSAADQYTYVAAPTITAVYPSSGPSAGGTSVIINGTHLNQATAVMFGATAATGYTINGPGQITATAPAGAVGTVDIRVTTAGGTSVVSAADQFTYVPAPTLTAVSPASGSVSGGNMVVLTGTNFSGATAVRFGANWATGYSVISPTQISAAAPAGAEGTVNIFVTTAGGSSATAASNQYTYVSAPVVSAVSPNVGPTAGGTTVTITGINFNGATAVSFGGVAATSYTVDSATRISATAPAGVAGIVDIRVTTASGTSAVSAADRYSYVAPPTVTAVSPMAGPTAGGTTVVISGSNLGAATAVTFGGTPASYTVNSANQITATAPAGAAGTVDIRVISAGGSSAIGAADQYTFVAAPVVTAVAPSAGPTSGGTTVVISGSNFSGATGVRFGTNAASSYIVNSPTQITATAPAGAVGTVDVRVTTLGGASATSTADRFSYQLAPTVVSIDRASANPTNASAVTFTVTFSEPVTGVDLSDLSLRLAGVNGVLAGISGSGSLYNVTVDHISGSGTVQLDLNASGTGIRSAAGIDLAGGFNSGQVFTVDTINPVVASVGVPAAGHYLAGDVLLFTVSFSKPVSVTGVPRLGLLIGSSIVQAGYASGSGSSSLSFRYTVASGDGDTDGIAIANAIDLNGGTLNDVTGNTAVLTLNNVGPTNAVLVGQNPQSIDFAAQPGHGYVHNGAFALDPVATASSGLAVSYSVAPASATVCRISGSTVTMLSAGSCVVAADQAGNAYWLPAPQVTRDIVIAPLAQAISGFAANPAAPVFTPGGSFTLAATGGASGQPVVFASSTAPVCTVSGATVTMIAAGTCALTADQAGTAVYSAAPQQQLSVVIGAASQAITGFAANPAAPTFVPDGTFTLSATGSASGEPVVFASTTASVCTVNGSTVTMLSAGSCGLTANQAGNDRYSAAPEQTLGVLIGQATQAITGFSATPAAPVFVPDGTFSVAASGGASGQPVVFASTTAAVCAVNGSTVTMLTAGSCGLSANQAGNDSYAAAPQQVLQVAIGAAAQVISGFTANPGTPVFAPDGRFTVSATGGASGEPVLFASTTTAVCSVSGSSVTMLAAGTCALTADQAGNDRYAAAAQQHLEVVIGAATQVISGFAATPGTPVFAPNGSFSVAARGGASGQPVTFSSTSANVCTVSGTTVTMLAAGSCLLAADQAGTANYGAAARVTLEVLIGKAAPTLAWVADMRRLLSEGAFDLPDPSSDAPGAFTFTSSNGQVATVSGRTVSIIGAGVTTLTATLPASANFLAASVSLQLTVDERPDPTQEASVAAGVQAQLDASVRFVQAQQDNIRGRLGQLRHGRNASSNGLALSMQGGMNQPGLSLRADQVGAKPPTLAAGWGLWSAGSIIQGERDARGASQGFSFRSDGLSLGVDRIISDSLVLGAAGGFGWNDTDFDGGGSAQEATQRSLALYGVWHAQQWFVDGLLGVGQLDFDLKRRSTVVDATATGSRDGDQRFASMTLGYDHAGKAGTLTGYGRLDASRTTLDAYREQGLGIYDLQYARQRVDSSTAAVGVEGRYNVRTARAMLRPSWLLEWRQALRNDGDAELNYVVAPRDNNYVLGLRSYNDDLLAVGAGLDVVFDSGWNLSFLYRREQARDVFSNSFGLRIGYGRALAPISAEQAWFQNSGLTRPVVEAGAAAGKP